MVEVTEIRTVTVSSEVFQADKVLDSAEINEILSNLFQKIKEYEEEFNVKLKDLNIEQQKHRFYNSMNEICGDEEITRQFVVTGKYVDSYKFVKKEEK
jgi:hypothetical protein